MALPLKDKQDIIDYRILKRRQTFQEAKDNAALQHWSLAANRLDYASFYLAMAINLKDGEHTKTHSGTFNLISKKYIASGLFSKEEGHLYRQLFSMRQTGDYDDLFDWAEEDILPIISEVEELLMKMESLLQN